VLDALVDSLGSARLLLLVQYRPEYQHPWSGKTSYSQLRLDALPAKSAGELLDALLGDDPGLAPLKDLLVRRGNPFFLEETVRTLVETKALGGTRTISADATNTGDPGPGLGPAYPGGAHLLQGDWTNARTFIEHPIAAYRAGNVVMVRRSAICSSSWVLAQLGEEREAQSRLREGEQLLERYAATGVVGYRSWTIHSLGRACLLLGRLDEAQGLGERTIESHPEHAVVAAHSLHLLGDIAAHPDRFEAGRGEAYYRQALALAEPRVMRPLVVHCHLGLGKLYRRTGRRTQAHGHLTTAMTMYREMDMPFWAEKATLEVTALT
jgi:hypothetical protein